MKVRNEYFIWKSLDVEQEASIARCYLSSVGDAIRTLG